MELCCTVNVLHFNVRQNYAVNIDQITQERQGKHSNFLYPLIVVVITLVKRATVICG